MAKTRLFALRNLTILGKKYQTCDPIPEGALRLKTIEVLVERRHIADVSSAAGAKLLEHYRNIYA